MNILLYVTTLLTLLAILTFAKIESYRLFSVSKGLFLDYMEKTERIPINKGFENQYERAHFSKGANGGPREKAEGLSKLSIASMFDNDETAELFGQLVHLLYGNEPFFQKAERQRADLIKELIDGMRRARGEHSFPIDRIEKLANLELQDPLLAELLYKILKGGPASTPLGAYATMRPAAKVRVFLAPPPVLALFFEEKTVGDILEARLRLYREVVNGQIESGEAGALFEQQFQEKTRANAPAGRLDFTVSKTRPRSQDAADR